MGQSVPEGDCFPTIEKLRIRAEVERVLSHREFRASKRNKRFLEFVVAETLAGRGERIKAYTIAVDVFGRGAEFDPSADPIVRIEATRLRTALASFYKGPGCDAPLRVIVPKGKYIPSFVGVIDGNADSCDGAGEMIGSQPVRALVELICAAGCESSDMAYLANDLTIQSLRTSDVRVIYAPPERRVAARKTFDDFLREPGSAYAIDILVTAVSLCWRVSSLADSEILSCERIDHGHGGEVSVGEIQKVTQRIARFIAAQPIMNSHKSSGLPLA